MADVDVKEREIFTAENRGVKLSKNLDRTSTFPDGFSRVDAYPVIRNSKESKFMVPTPPALLFSSQFTITNFVNFQVSRVRM